jgi:tRNA-2-methylthio-N6-dimethylallyladenosine synthase
MTGCDNFCSYCAVPYTRGREISRPFNDIISDIKQALKNGSKEILLLGQNVNSYYKRSSVYNRKIDNRHFIKLLTTIDNLPGDFKFNFISSNPHDMSNKLIKTLAKLKKWPRELHLPLQSGDDEILRKMNRKYNRHQYLKLVANLKSQIPDLKLTTDIIVGFPGETKEQFNNTVKLCKKIGFKKAYIAQYSPRPGTAAAKLKDDVPAKEKKRRWQLLNRLINKKRRPARLMAANNNISNKFDSKKFGPSGNF